MRVAYLLVFWALHIPCCSFVHVFSFLCRGHYLCVCVHVKMSEGIILFVMATLSLSVSELLLSRRDLSVLFSPLHCAASPLYYPETSFLLWRIKISFPFLPQPDCWVKPLNRHLLSWTCSMLLKTTRAWGPAPQNKFTKSMTLGTLLKWWPVSQISAITQNGGKQALNVTVAAVYRTPLLYQFRVNAAHAIETKCVCSMH